MGYTIKERRRVLWMTQAELADRSGVSRSSISELENNQKKITITKTLLRIVAALETPIDGLFFTKVFNILNDLSFQ